MDIQPPLPGKSRWNSGRLGGATSNTGIIGTQQERSQKLVYHDTTNAATKHMTQDAHLKIVSKTGTSKNKKQHAVECQYIHFEVNSRQLTI